MDQHQQQKKPKLFNLFINGEVCICVCVLPDEWHGLCVCSAESRAFSCVCGLQSNEDQQGEDGTDRLDGSSGTAQGFTLLSREL